MMEFEHEHIYLENEILNFTDARKHEAEVKG